MTLRTKISELDIKQITNLNKKLRKVCSYILGDTNPNFRSISNPKVERELGIYDPDKHKIIIYRNLISTVDMYVRVYIHEWTHSTQRGIRKNYSKMNSKYGYKNNPFEIEARDNEKIFKSLVWRLVKKEL